MYRLNSLVGFQKACETSRGTYCCCDVGEWKAVITRCWPICGQQIRRRGLHGRLKTGTARDGRQGLNTWAWNLQNGVDWWTGYAEQGWMCESQLSFLQPKKEQSWAEKEGMLVQKQTLIGHISVARSCTRLSAEMSSKNFQFKSITVSRDLRIRISS